MNEQDICIEFYYVLLYTQSALQSNQGVSAHSLAVWSTWMIYIYIYIYIYLYIYIFIYLYIYIYIYVCVCMCVFLQLFFCYIYIYIYFLLLSVYSVNIVK